MRYVELAFTVPSAEAELWSERLCEAGAGGVEERDATTLEKPEPGTTVLVVWLEPERVDGYLARLPEARVLRRDRDEDEWRDAWKKYFGVRRVGRFLIVPSWERYVGPPEDIVLDLDPGRAFGTGGHASTRLCLLAIDAMTGPCRQFLDVGCGSGVLAIACARRWPEAHGVGVDNDPDAVEVSRENAERNQVGPRLLFTHQGVETVEGLFEVITANIQPEVLIPMAPLLAQRLAPGARLILSGILVEAAPGVESAYAAVGLPLEGSADEEGWRALTFALPGAERRGRGAGSLTSLGQKR